MLSAQKFMGYIQTSVRKHRHGKICWKRDETRKIKQVQKLIKAKIKMYNRDRNQNTNQKECETDRHTVKGDECLPKNVYYVL